MEDIRVERKKSTFNRFWNWFWKGDSLSSWIFSILLAFVLVKFVFFPGLSLVLGTSLPLVVVESSSMQHEGDLFKTVTGFAISDSVLENFWLTHGSWYTGKSISENEFKSWPFAEGLDKGDIIMLFGSNQPQIGDIIVFNANQPNPIIHRIINITELNGKKIYSTKGDNNPDQLTIEKQIPQDALIGKAILRIPKLGWVKLFFVDIINGLSGK
jgi:signal peptidase I